MKVSRDMFFMCQNSKNIQDVRTPIFEEGDWFINKEDVDLTRELLECELVSSCRCFDAPVKDPLKIWIPTQKQIQELILSKNKITTTFLLPSFCDTLLKEKSYCQLQDYWESFKTIDEAWLAFYYYDAGYLWNHRTLTWEKKTIENIISPLGI